DKQAKDENRNSPRFSSFDFRVSAPAGSSLITRHSSLAFTPSRQNLAHHLRGFGDLVGISWIEADNRRIRRLDVLISPFDGLALLFFRLAFAACPQDLINQPGFIHLAHGL